MNLFTINILLIIQLMNLDNKNEQNNLMKNNTYMPRRSSFKFLKKIIIEFF